MAAATYSDPTFRAWLNALKLPAFLDRDVLLAAGVIADDEDWLCWRDRGWLPFIIKASDAQQVALFGLVQRDLKDRKLAGLPTDLAEAIEGYRQASLTCIGDYWLPEGEDESRFDAHLHRQCEAQQTVILKLGSLTDTEVAAILLEAARRREGAPA